MASATRSSDITFLDGFCGAGGSSLGAKAAGARLVLALNHWPVAVATHSANHPEATTLQCDISNVSPASLGRLAYTTIALFSPECTAHSYARNNGGHRRHADPDLEAAAERSRMQMWDVPRFAEHAGYPAIIVENVVETLTGWRLFPQWLAAMRALDYDVTPVSLNSQFAWPTPQSRDRLYLVCTRRGNPAPDLDIRPRALCAECGPVDAVQRFKDPATVAGRYRAQYRYHCPRCAAVVEPASFAAASALDPAVPAPRVGDRSRPLSGQTLGRIDAALNRLFDGTLAVPLAATVPGADLRGRAVTAARHTALLPELNAAAARPSSAVQAVPHAPSGVFVKAFRGDRGHALAAPLGTITTHDHHWLLTLPDHARTALAAALADPAPASRAEALAVTRAWVTVDELGYRQFTPAELARGMGFPDPESYPVTGTNAQQMVQYGNAVTPPAMQLLVERVIASLSTSRRTPRLAA